MSSAGKRSAPGTAASAFVVGLVILAASHALLYLLLTGDARAALAAVEREHEVAHLEHARDPGPPPQPGGEAYSAWLRAYERWWAAKDHALHSRHATLVGGGMALSFLVGLGLLAQGLLRLRRMGGVRARSASRAGARRQGRTVPLRPVARPVAVRPVPVRRRRSA